ncbi:Uncharacterised protein [Anaerotruncus sp. 2789STDY5834896]|uniref:P22 coat protein-gene protein 5 n=1 Tax=uncultured Anaerotruncus sp. TaxID=905011 RepID=A0A1C6G1V3_9FIRM|nr:Uncharacterised protein [uncultured Anaerotruncus sp.]
MAVTNFIPTIWEARLLENYHNRSLADVITTAPTRIEGNKIVFGTVGAVATKDYAGTVEWDEIDVPKVELNMDQKKYFAFKVDDVDKVQAAGNLVDPTVAEASAAMNETVDKAVLKAIADGVAAGNKLGVKQVHRKNAYDLLVDMATKLNKNKVPKVNRYAVIDSEYLGLLSKDVRFTPNPKVLENGVVEGQTVAGLQICVSEELPVATSKTTIIALSKAATGHGKQLNEMEAMRLEGSFADGVRGLMVYGTGVLRDKSAVTAQIEYVDEPATQVNVINTTAAPVNTKEVAGA